MHDWVFVIRPGIALDLCHLIHLVARTLLVVVIGTARIPRLEHPVLGLGRLVAFGNADSLLRVLVTVAVRVDSHHPCEAIFFTDEGGVGFEFAVVFRQV